MISYPWLFAEISYVSTKEQQTNVVLSFKTWSNNGVGDILDFGVSCTCVQCWGKYLPPFPPKKWRHCEVKGSPQISHAVCGHSNSGGSQLISRDEAVTSSLFRICGRWTRLWSVWVFREFLLNLHRMSCLVVACFVWEALGASLSYV